METVRAITLVREKLGVNTVLGVSNISFGLPQRELVNSVFFRPRSRGSPPVINSVRADDGRVQHLARARARHAVVH